jgi:glucosamine-6-phosphate deaminase
VVECLSCQSVKGNNLLYFVLREDSGTSDPGYICLKVPRIPRHDRSWRGWKLAAVAVIRLFRRATRHRAFFRLSPSLVPSILLLSPFAFFLCTIPPCGNRASTMSTATNALALGVAAAAVWVAAKRAQAMKRGSAQKGYRIVCRPDTYILGESSARYVAEKVKEIVAEKGCARVIFATGASQFNFINSLVALGGIPWDKVTAFHLDEYVNLPGGEAHPASFRKYLSERLFSKLRPPCKQVNLIDPDRIDDYAKLLGEDIIDLACIGIGENGHIAFNDPPVADFNDPKLIKVVALDEKCRMQQVGEGWFSSLAEAPSQAVSLTCPCIMAARHISCVVPDERKAVAVKDTNSGVVTTKCPASILTQHRDCIMWIDEPAASLLPADVVDRAKVA